MGRGIPVCMGREICIAPLTLIVVAEDCVSSRMSRHPSATQPRVRRSSNDTMPYCTPEGSSRKGNGETRGSISLLTTGSILRCVASRNSNV